MPHDLTITPSFGAVVTVPDDGDPRVAASVQLPFQQLANRTGALNAGCTSDWACGRDLSVARDLVVTRDFAADGNTALDTLYVGTASSLNGATTCTALTASGVITANDNIEANANLHVVGQTVCSGQLIANIGVTILGASTLSNRLVVGPGGQILEASEVGPDDDHTFFANETQHVIVPTLTIARFYTVSDTGAQPGSHIKFCNKTYTPLVVTLPGGSFITLVRGTPLDWAVCRRYGATWYFDEAGNFN